MSGFRVPFQPSETEFTEKRSRFIGHLLPVKTEEQAREFIGQMKRKYYDARHNCWCYLIGDSVVRYSDDGEPQGTAGQPMLNVFQRENVTDVVCVVTRYFGGVLLGAGGLVRAYSQGAAAAINACGVGCVYPTVRYLIELPYPMLGRFEFFLKSEPVLIEDKQFTDVVTFTLVLRTDDEPGFLARLTDSTDGAIEPLRYEEFLRPWPEA